MQRIAFAQRSPNWQSDRVIEESLGYAVFTCDLARVCHLLAHGADANEPWGTGTLLLEVVDEPSQFFDDDALQIARALLHAGASVDASNEDGMRPIHAATRADHPALTLLIEAGADLNGRMRSTGNAPLHCAVEHENVAGVKLLLMNGADRSLVNNDNETVLATAMRIARKAPSRALSEIIGLLQPDRS